MFVLGYHKYIMVRSGDLPFFAGDYFRIFLHNYFAQTNVLKNVSSK